MFEMMCPSAQHNEATLLPVIGYAKKRCKGNTFFPIFEILFHDFERVREKMCKFAEK